MEENKEEELIKEECLLSGKVTSTITDDNIKKIIIKKEGEKGAYLSEVLNRLPHGLVSKEETGMGATSLELNTPRNSIIVEPIKITASSKANNHSKTPNEKVLYVGSETKYHPKKTTKDDIVAYINNPNIIHKKIIVVADSLQKVINAIGETIYNDFFLLIDEVDSFQMDSTFRKSMEECIDYYKKFDKDKRCMLSATLIDFSEPELSKEKKTEISYDTNTKRTIHIIKTNTPSITGITTEKIKELLQNFPDEKIMIALNSVKKNNEIANYLKDEGVLNEDDIKILCSKSSKKKVGKFYTELDSNSLPGKVNFVTSAYFSGFDLEERYHLISVSGNKNAVHSLSDKRLKQIAGRCRDKDGLLSETVIHDLADIKKDETLKDKGNLIQIAQTQIDALLCIESHYSRNPTLKRIHHIISDQIMEALEKEKMRFIKRDKFTGEFSISYLNIDAVLENSKTRFDLYKDYDLLYTTLKSQQHNVDREYKTTTTLVPKIDIDKLDRKTKLQEVIGKLRLTQSNTDVEILLQDNELGDFQRKIVEHYKKLNFYIDKDNLLDKIEKEADSKDSRGLNRLILSAYFSVMAPGDLYKSRMNKYFPIGKSFTEEELTKRIQLFFSDCHLSNCPDTHVKTIRFLRAHFKIPKSRTFKTFKVKSENPYKLKINRVRQEAEDIVLDPFLLF